MGTSGTPATRHPERKLKVLANVKDEQKLLLLHECLSSAPWTSASGLPSYLNSLVFYHSLPRIFYFQKIIWRTFWVTYCDIWHICLPFLSQTRSGVKLKQMAGPKDFQSRGGTSQRGVLVKGAKESLRVMTAFYQILSPLYVKAQRRITLAGSLWLDGAT